MTVKTQNEEFTAAKELAKQLHRIELTPPVDDDFPFVFAEYNLAVSKFIEACARNNRSNVMPEAIGNPNELVTILKYKSIPHINIANRFRAVKWHPEGLGSWSPSDWMTALVGEVGEACNVIKKMNRLRDGLQQKQVEKDAKIAGVSVDVFLRAQLEMEIGDAYLYLDLLASTFDLPLEQCVRKTFNRVSVREGFTDRL